MTALLPPVVGAGRNLPHWTASAEQPVGVVGSGWYLPERVVGNTELAALLGVDAAWVLAQAGVSSRRWAAPGESRSDLATEAARRALQDSGVRAEQLGVVVVVSGTADLTRPSPQVQQRLGAGGAAVLDIDGDDFVGAMSVAHLLVVATGRHGLVIGAERHTLDPFEPALAARVGDGAGAVVLGPAPGGHGLRAVELAAAGPLHADPAGEGTPPVNGSVTRMLRAAQVDPAQVAHVVTNRVPDSVPAALGLPHAAGHGAVHEHGDTGAATVPIALSRAATRITRGQQVLLADLPDERPGTAADTATPALALLTW